MSWSQYWLRSFWELSWVFRLLVPLHVCAMCAGCGRGMCLWAQVPSGTWGFGLCEAGVTSSLFLSQLSSLPSLFWGKFLYQCLTLKRKELTWSPCLHRSSNGNRGIPPHRVILSLFKLYFTYLLVWVCWDLNSGPHNYLERKRSYLLSHLISHSVFNVCHSFFLYY